VCVYVREFVGLRVCVCLCVCLCCVHVCVCVCVVCTSVGEFVL